jgi:glycerophosphoryl diester phosphodiesterase
MRLRRILAASAAFFVALTLAGAAPAAAAATSCPTVISHAAGRDLAPENTTKGITMVTAAGARWVEMDVRWSKGDGTAAYPGWPVLMHDPTVDRTTGGTGNVADMGLGNLTALAATDYAPATDPTGAKWSARAGFAGTDSHVPYAYDFLSATYHGGASALLDVKVTPTKVQADKLMEYVDRFPGMRSRIIYMGDAANIQAMRGWYPDLTYAFIEYPAAGVLRSNAYLRSIGADLYAVPSQNADLDAASVAYHQAAGIPTYVWTSDNLTTIDVEASWRRAQQIGASAVITNKAAQVADLYADLCPDPTPSS